MRCLAAHRSLSFLLQDWLHSVPDCLLMLNSHRPPDTTRQCCLCRVRRCELSLETVWQSLSSQPIDHPRLVAFSEEFRFARMQQPTACLHFAWRTTSLRVGGRAARRRCLPGGGRQAGATVLSCLVWRCELSQSDCRTSAFCVGVRPTQTRHWTHLSGGRADSTHQTRQNSPVCVVSGVACELALTNFVYIFTYREISHEIEISQSVKSFINASAYRPIGRYRHTKHRKLMTPLKLVACTTLW